VSLFGGQSTTGTRHQQQPTTSLFSQPAIDTQQQQSTSHFGQPAAGGTQQTTGQPTGATNWQQQQKPTTSLFGQPTTGTQQPQSMLGMPSSGSTTQSRATVTQTTGLFGSIIQAQPAMTGTSLFGSTLQPQATAPTTGFGAGTTSILFGAQRQPPRVIHISHWIGDRHTLP